MPPRRRARSPPRVQPQAIDREELDDSIGEIERLDTSIEELRERLNGLSGSNNEQLADQMAELEYQAESNTNSITELEDQLEALAGSRGRMGYNTCSVKDLEERLSLMQQELNDTKQKLDTTSSNLGWLCFCIVCCPGLLGLVSKNQ